MDDKTWSARIRDLQESGLTLLEIAGLTGMAPSSIGDIATGRTSEPRGEAAVRIHRLHEERCGRSRLRA